MSLLAVTLITLVFVAIAVFLLRLSWKDEIKEQGETFVLVSGIKALVVTELPFVAVRAWSTVPFVLTTEKQTEKARKFADGLYIVETTVTGENWSVTGTIDSVNVEIEEKKTVWIGIPRNSWYKFRDLLTAGMFFLIWILFILIVGIK